MSHEEFVAIIRKPIKLESPRFAEQLKQFCNRCSYVSGHEGGDKSFEALHNRLEEIGHGKKERNHLFYMALPPSIFVPMSQMLKKHCYSERGETRVIVSVHLLEKSSRQASKADDGHTDRLRNPLVMTSRARANCRSLWIRIGEKRRSFEWITIWARK